MEIAVKAMKLGQKTESEYMTLTLHEFFVQRAHEFKENQTFPFAFPTSCSGEPTTWCSVLEGGCQFAFDRDRNHPIRCINCDNEDCKCNLDGAHGRYALQRFTRTRIVLLDVDQNKGTRRRAYGEYCKYHTLTYEEEEQLRAMECRLMELESLIFFYRTKCNGFRIGFDAGRELSAAEDYEREARCKETILCECTPDGRLSDENHPGGALFHVDSVSYRGQAYWSYPRVYHPVWLNPERDIE